MDRANVHRLENSGHRPRYETVKHLVRALNATPEEATQLFEHAGYQAPIWPTTAADFEAVHADLSAQWLSDGSPATLIADVYWKVWYANRAFAQLCTLAEPAAFIGKHVLELCLQPAFGYCEALGRIATPSEVNAFLLLAVARFRRRVRQSQGEILAPEDLERLHTLPGFTDLWASADSAQSVPDDHLVGVTCLKLRTGRDLIVHSAFVRKDRRFLVTHYLPADDVSAEIG